MSAHGSIFSKGGASAKPGAVHINNLVVDNVVRNVSAFGIAFFRGAMYNNAANNVITDCGTGLVIDDTTTGVDSIISSHNSFIDNEVANCSMGIVIEGSDYNLVRNNIISNEKGGLVGIDIWAGGYDGVSRRLPVGNIILGNYVDSATNYSMRIVADSVYISSNTFANSVGDSILVRSIRDWDDQATIVNRVTFSENKVSGSGGHALNIEEGHNIKVDNNIFQSITSAPILIAPNYTSGVSEVEISNNKFEDVKEVGILLVSNISETKFISAISVLFNKFSFIDSSKVSNRCISFDTTKLTINVLDNYLFFPADNTLDKCP